MKLNRKKLNQILVISSAVMMAITLIFVVVLLSLGFSGKLASNNNSEDSGNKNQGAISATEVAGSTGKPSSSATEKPTDVPGTPEPVTYSEITLLGAGDLMVYGGQVDSAKRYGGGTCDFSESTKYLLDIIGEHDYAALNFEATVSEGNYKYYPTFHVPDQILDTVKASGFDMVLFANNHTYDNGRYGLLRTQEQIAARGLPCIGTRQDTESKSYAIKDVNGVKLGMLNYTYEAPPAAEKESTTEKFLNGIRLEKYCPQCKYCVENSEITGDGKHTSCGAEIIFARDLVDSFNPNLLDRFYTEISARIDEMKKDGADFIVVYLHWGYEYQDYPNTMQKEISQKLCDMGVDLLVGGHPHVVQPVATYTSADGENKMLCYYSLGNFISGQNRAVVSAEQQAKYILTENGLLSSVTIRKYSTGETVISNADYVPTWMHRHSVDGRVVFNVVPLEKALASDQAMEAYGLNESSFGVKHATAALEYLKGLVQPGIDEFNKAIVLPHPEAISAEK